MKIHNSAFILSLVFSLATHAMTHNDSCTLLLRYTSTGKASITIQSASETCFSIDFNGKKHATDIKNIELLAGRYLTRQLSVAMPINHTATIVKLATQLQNIAPTTQENYTTLVNNLEAVRASYTGSFAWIKNFLANEYKTELVYTRNHSGTVQVEKREYNELGTLINKTVFQEPFMPHTDMAEFISSAHELDTLLELLEKPDKELGEALP